MIRFKKIKKMSADMLIDINRLEEEAKGYLDGKRAQTDMFAEAI